MGHSGMRCRAVSASRDQPAALLIARAAVRVVGGSGITRGIENGGSVGREMDVGPGQVFLELLERAGVLGEPLGSLEDTLRRDEQGVMWWSGERPEWQDPAVDALTCRNAGVAPIRPSDEYITSRAQERAPHSAGGSTVETVGRNCQRTPIT